MKRLIIAAILGLVLSEAHSYANGYVFFDTYAVSGACTGTVWWDTSTDLAPPGRAGQWVLDSENFHADLLWQFGTTTGDAGLAVPTKSMPGCAGGWIGNGVSSGPMVTIPGYTGGPITFTIRAWQGPSFEFSTARGTLTWTQSSISTSGPEWFNHNEFPGGWGAPFTPLFVSLGATITVTNLNDSGPGSLRQAIADATPGETIDFAVTGTITLTSGELAIDKDLTINGPGAANLMVSGNNISRVFQITDGIATISGLTIANGFVGGNGPMQDYGGGIWNSSTLTVSNCVFAFNSGNAGGGIFCGNPHNYAAPSRMTVMNSSFLENRASDGGAIDCWPSAQAIIINSTFSSNSAAWGGAITVDGYFPDPANVVLTNCTLSGNWANYGGGILNSDLGSLVVSGCTIAGNGAGYGIYDWPSFPGTPSSILINSIVAGNLNGDVAGTINSLDYNLIENTNGATITGITTHNIYGKDPLLGPLADNGGPTWTHALLPGSPAIDHGSTGGMVTDQRGQPRPFNFPAYFNADDGSDIGAYELQERAQTGPVFTVNTTDDVDDGVPGIAHCSLREAINAANASSGSNSITFAAAVPGIMNGVTGTIVLTTGELSITDDLGIGGPGRASLIISGNHGGRVFSIPNASCVTLSGLTVADGLAGNQGYGGGINTQGKLTISNCELRGNNADRFGGAIHTTSYSGGSLSIVNSLLHNNSAGWAGGAVYNDGCATVVASCIFSNTASDGGAIWAGFGGSTTFVTNCTISGNVTTGTAGGIGNAIGACVYIDSCTICSNHADVAGGGLRFGGAYTDVFSIRNTIVSGNSILPGVHGPDVDGWFLSADYNLIQNPTSGSFVGVTAHNIYNQAPKLGPLADLGGPTPTHALRFDSPAIDAGSSGGLTTDQRGFPRPIDDPNTPNANGGDGCDIGAFEADPILRMTGIEKAGQDVWLSFSSMLGRTYRLESTENLAVTWSTRTNGVPGTGSLLQAIDAGGATLPRRFYRAVLLP